MSRGVGAIERGEIAPSERRGTSGPASSRAATPPDDGVAEPVSVGRVAEAVHEDANLPKLTLTVESDCVVAADRQRLRQLLDNLFRNAAKHGLDEDDDGITVTVGRLPDGFYVEDTGSGIPDEARDSLFEYGTTTHRDGTGFGLGIVHDIVTAHGWSIAVTDGSSGGARFEITSVDVEQ